jgi:hypothetical protein
VLIVKITTATKIIGLLLQLRQASARAGTVSTPARHATPTGTDPYRDLPSTPVPRWKTTAAASASAPPASTGPRLTVPRFPGGGSLAFILLDGVRTWPTTGTRPPRRVSGARTRARRPSRSSSDPPGLSHLCVHCSSSLHGTTTSPS